MRQAIILAGPNGSGKTTFAREYLRTYPYAFVNADEIAREISPEHPEKVRVQAGRAFFQILDSLLQRGENLIIETTVSGRSFQNIFDQLESHHYETVIYFLFLESPEVCIKRIRERVLKGGHHIPPDEVERRFFRSKRNFWNQYRYCANQWFLFYNNDVNGFQIVAVGSGKDFTIRNEQLFNLFIQDIKDYTND